MTSPASARRDPCIAAVVFDLGGVLIDWNPRHLYRKLIAGEPDMERFLATITTQEWNRQLDGGRSFAEAVEELSRAHPEQAELINAYRLRWDEMLAGALEQSVTVLADLRAAGMPVYGLTNWSAETFDVARRRFPFLSWFGGIVVSGEVGVLKPDPRIFRVLFDRCSLVPERSVFIDDAPANVEAAAELGMYAIRFTTGEALRAELARLGLVGQRPGRKVVPADLDKEAGQS